MSRLSIVFFRCCVAGLIIIGWSVGAAENAKYRDYRIYFTNDSSSITEEASKNLTLIAEKILKNKAKVIIVGHTDTTGARGYNRRLSMYRAVSVAKELRVLGVKPHMIQTTGKGEDDLLYLTPDATPEPLNRCVVITIIL